MWGRSGILGVNQQDGGLAVGVSLAVPSSALTASLQPLLHCS